MDIELDLDRNRFREETHDFVWDRWIGYNHMQLQIRNKGSHIWKGVGHKNMKQSGWHGKIEINKIEIERIEDDAPNSIWASSIYQDSNTIYQEPNTINNAYERRTKSKGFYMMLKCKVA